MLALVTSPRLLLLHFEDDTRRTQPMLLRGQLERSEKLKVDERIVIFGSESNHGPLVSLELN